MALFYDLLSGCGTYEDADGMAKLYCTLSSLYRVGIFVIPINFMFYLLEQRVVRFSVLHVSAFEKNQEGFCRSSDSSNKSSKVGKAYDIVLKYPDDPALVIHEIMHAVDIESGVRIGEDFVRLVHSDIAANSGSSFFMKSVINEILEPIMLYQGMRERIAELFARFFEIPTMTVEFANASPKYPISQRDFDKVFSKTLLWLENEFYPLLHSRISPSFLAAISTSGARRERAIIKDGVSNKWTNMLNKRKY